MPAQQIAHGTIEITAPKGSAQPVAASQPATTSTGLGQHAISTGAPPEPVVQFVAKTPEQIAAEAAQHAEAQK